MTANHNKKNRDHYFASFCEFPNYPRTQWFPASVDPVHPGDYENRDSDGRVTGRNHWNGKQWTSAVIGVIGKDSRYAWRGLAWRVGQAFEESEIF